MPQSIELPSRFLLILDELERYKLPPRVRRDPPPPKKPVRPHVKPRTGEIAASIEITNMTAGWLTHVGGEYARSLMARAEAEGCRTAVSIADWLNERGYRGGMGGLWTKGSVNRVSGRNLADYEARLAHHTATIREALKDAKAAGCGTSKRADFLNDRNLRTIGEHVWDRKSVARWWKAHG